MTTALSLVNTLRAKTRAVDLSIERDENFGWGTYKVTRESDVLPEYARLQRRNEVE